MMILPCSRYGRVGEGERYFMLWLQKKAVRANNAVLQELFAVSASKAGW